MKLLRGSRCSLSPLLTFSNRGALAAPITSPAAPTPEKTFTNTDEVIKALDKQNFEQNKCSLHCDDTNSRFIKMFLSNETQRCKINISGLEFDYNMSESQSKKWTVRDQASLWISTYDDIKQVDLFKDKCKKNDMSGQSFFEIAGYGDCSDMLEYTFFHGNVAMTYYEQFVPKLSDGSKNLQFANEMRSTSKDTMDSILEDLLD